MTWTQLAIAIVLTISGGIGTLVQLAGLPGTWLILLAAVFVRAIETFFPLGNQPILSWTTLAILAALAILAEVAEFLAAAAGARTGGASKRGMAGAVVGGLLGALVGTFALPIPPIGSIVGAVVGSALGAITGELSEGGRTLASTAKPAAGAVVGRIVGTLAKSIFAAAMWAVVTVAAFA